jgi:hypothetical protein
MDHWRLMEKSRAQNWDIAPQVHAQRMVRRAPATSKTARRSIVVTDEFGSYQLTTNTALLKKFHLAP